MRKALLHPVCCLAVCLVGLYLLRREIGVPDSSLWLGPYIALCGYICHLALIPWICFSDWGRVMRKKKMGDAGVIEDPIFILLMLFTPRYVALAALGALASIGAGTHAIAGLAAVSVAGFAAMTAWRVMRWSPNPT